MGFVRVGEVAAHAGVSAGTVSNFFHNPERVAAATAARIRAAIDDLDYVPNDAARALRRGQSKIIGHLSFEVANPYSAEFVDAVDRHARDLGYTVLSASSGGDSKRQSDYLDLFARQRVDGVIMSPVGDVGSAVERLIGHGIPLVLTDSVDASTPSVSFDDVRAGSLAAAHLLELGHRHLGFVGHATDIGIIERRLRGVREALEGYPDARLSVYDLDDRSISSGRRVGERLAAADPRERPTGIIAVNDLVAVGILHGVFGLVRVPEDIAIVGFDDIDFAAEAVIPLSSVRRPVAMLATRAVDALHARILGQTDAERLPEERLVPTLVVRGSTVASV